MERHQSEFWRFGITTQENGNFGPEEGRRRTTEDNGNSGQTDATVGVRSQQLAPPWAGRRLRDAVLRGARIASTTPNPNPTTTSKPSPERFSPCDGVGGRVKNLNRGGAVGTGRYHFPYCKDHGQGGLFN